MLPLQKLLQIPLNFEVQKPAHNSNPRRTEVPAPRLITQLGGEDKQT